MPRLPQGCPSNDHKGGRGLGESTQPRVRQNCGFDFTLPPTCCDFGQVAAPLWVGGGVSSLLKRGH